MKNHWYPVVCFTLVLGLMVPTEGLSQDHSCKGTKVFYRGKCRYPDEIRKLKAKSKRAKRPTPTRKRPKSGVVWDDAPLDWTRAYQERFGVSYARERVYRPRRAAMVSEHLERDGTFDRDVVDAMARLPMELFCPTEVLSLAYQNRPVPIGYDESISQPQLTAYMLTLLGIKPGDRVLELKTASGYQTAIMAMLGAKVYTVESDRLLGRRLREIFKSIGGGNIHLKLGGNVHRGWAEHGPYDVIVATAAYTALPHALIRQLKLGGRILAPIGPGNGAQALRVFNKTRDGKMKYRDVLEVRFSMMPGSN